MPVYAIAKGRTRAIVETWDECKSLVNGFNGAIYKKCKNVEEANAYLAENPAADLVGEEKEEKLVQPQQVIPAYWVYTDGSCSNNGGVNAKAGIGIYFGTNDPRNRSQRVEGKQTNNTAELSAFKVLFPLIEQDIRKGVHIGIGSDSVYALRCVQTYGARNAKEGWTKDIPNKELVREVYELYKPYKTIQYIHVDAHTTNTDSHSLGNSEADRLANEAIGLTACPYARLQVEPEEQPRFIYDVPYARKEEFKALGGKWDPKKKTWYLMEESAKANELFPRKN